MARLEANPTPSILVWAREAAGLTTATAADKVGISADRLTEWESGIERPTFAQLRKLATVYKRPLAIFYLAEPPKGFAPMHDFRRVAEHAGLPNSPELTLEIRRAHDRREWALELFEQIEEVPRELEGTLAITMDPETAAAEVRRVLKVALKDQTSWRDDYEAFRKWRLLVERAGILTFQANNVETTEARGVSTSERPLPVAVMNIKDAPRGRIFTCFMRLFIFCSETAGSATSMSRTGITDPESRPFATMLRAQLCSRKMHCLGQTRLQSTRRVNSRGRMRNLGNCRDTSVGAGRLRLFGCSLSG